MQTADNTDTINRCYAIFKNCTVERINVKAAFAGGLYGGTWSNNWAVFSLDIENCKVIGDESNNNSIEAVNTYCGDSLGKNNFSYAGGLVGKGYVVDGASDGTYNVHISNSKVKNYNITDNNAQNNNCGSGGFIGYADTYASNITLYIHDSSVEDCKIGENVNNVGNYAGGAVGRINKKTSNKLLGYNIKLDNVTSNSSNMGAWIGYLTSGDTGTSIQFTGLAIYGNGFTKNVGNNVNLSNAAFVYADYDGACKNMTDDAEELAQQDTTKVQANKATFNVDSDVTMPRYPYVNVNPQSKMGVREDSTNAVISGDGAVLLENKVPTYSIYTSGQTMAAKLYADIKTGTSSRRYTTCADMLKNTIIADGNRFEDYLMRTVTSDGDRISTYKTEKGNLPTGVDDFACIMISTADSAETTNLINQYIRLVTNTTDDYADTNDYYDVDIKTCKLVEDQATGTGEFQLITNPSDPDYTPGIEHDKTNKLFKMTKNKQNADSNKENTFTLIDVQFKDPLDKTKVAYHLYVPVFTTVQLEVNFSAAMKSGTNSVSYLADGITVDRSEYESILDKEEYIHIDNLNTWYTMYFRYSYSKNDLQPLLNAGNLNWNHDKYVTLTKLGNANTNMLPDNTFMTLVNPNSGADKVYYVDALNSTNFPRTTYTDGNNETRVSLTLDFKKFKGVDDQPFKVATLNEMVAQSIEAVPVEGETPDGQYDLYEGGGEPADFTTVSYVYVMDAAGSKTYYQYNPGSGHYNLQFKSGFTGLDEDYYVSVYVPDTDMTKIYGYDISIGDKFPAPRVPNALPKSANVVTEYDSRLVYLGDLYKQTVTFQVKTPDQVITSSNKVLDAYAVTHIEAKSVPVLGILASAKQYTDLFHSYVLTLDRHGENGEIMTRIYGLDKNEDQSSRVTAWYSFDNQIPDDDNPTAALVNNVDVQNNYINVATVKDTDNLMDRIAPNANDITPVTIYSRVRMDFDPTKLETEFPQKTRTDAGVSVRVASNLAYDTSGLAFSSSSKSANDNLGHLYYRTSMDTANLYYKPLTPNLDKYDYDGEYSENYTRVGVNGRRSMSDYMPIDTIANYDYSKVVQAWDEAVNVRLSISLQKKTDTKVDGKVTGVQYANISDITQYWGGIELVADDSGILKPKETLFEHNGNSSFRLTLKDTTSIIINNQEYPVNANTETITVTVPKNTLECDTASYLATIPISFNAKTGTTITQYANYKVNLTVQLLDGSGDPIESCTANDWLVYTNAKINHEFLNNGDD